MAATLKCTKMQVQRDWQDSATPHRITTYATDTVVPGVGNVSAAGMVSNATLENASTLRTTVDLFFTTAGLPTIDWTK